MKAMRQQFLYQLKVAYGWCCVMMKDLPPAWCRVFRGLRLVLLGATALALSACTALIPLVADPLTLGPPTRSGPGYVWHGFSHFSPYDSPNIAVLDYEYGQFRPQASDYASEGVIKETRWNYERGSSGTIKRGDFLYVKWLSLIDNKIFEERVDLRDKLPRNIEGHRITYSIRNNLFYVWLVSPEKREKNKPIVGPIMYREWVVYQIYPVVQ